MPWPVGYSDISHWYSHVESFIGVSGRAEGWSHLPDSEFLPPMEYYKIEKTLKNRMRKNLKSITMGRVAVLTVPIKDAKLVIIVGHVIEAVLAEATLALRARRFRLLEKPAN